MAWHIAPFHGPWFLQARLSLPAPRLDIQLWNQMCMYEAVYCALATEVKKSIQRHLWYLSKPLVISALFDTDVDLATKATMATRLRNSPKPINFPTGNPVLTIEMCHLTRWPAAMAYVSASWLF